MTIESHNKHMVGGSGRGVVIVLTPRAPMTAADAMNLAVWLFVLASCEEDAPTKEEFDAAITAAFNA